MRVLRDNLLVKELMREQIGKIVLPESVPDDWCRGEVKGVGPGSLDITGERIEMEVKVGDIVVFPPSRAGIYPTVLVEGENLIILPETLIWAIEG